MSDNLAIIPINSGNLNAWLSRFANSSLLSAEDESNEKSASFGKKIFADVL